MKLIKIAPRILHKEIKYFYLLKSDWANEVPAGQGHLPDGTFELIFSYGAPVHHSRSNGDFTRRDDVLFIGGYKKFHQVKYSGNIHLIGVVFDQGHIARVLGDRMNHSEEILSPARFVFNQEIDFLAEQLRHITDMELIRSVLENYLIRMIPEKVNHQTSKASLAVDIMLRSRGKVGIKNLAGELCMSERNFRRTFSESTGFSPREMLRIIRTKRLIHLLKKGISMRQAARELAYYNAPHIMHDFKALTGTTPREYLSQMNIIDLNFFEKSEYAI